MKENKDNSLDLSKHIDSYKIDPFVNAELTLETIGFFSPSTTRLRQTVKQKILTGKNSAGEIETHTVEISPNLKYGLPITADLDFYRAFQEILHDLHRKRVGLSAFADAAISSRLPAALGSRVGSW